jgi:hypothetical protein
MGLKNKIIFSVIWIGITLLALGIISRNVNLPHRHVYFNWDEAHYGAAALELVASGTRVNSKVIPDGFYEMGNINVGYPSILSFFQYPAVKYFGFTRPALRSPGLLLFCLGSGILLFLWWSMGLGILHGSGLMASYLLSPWMYLAATTARAESVSVFFILVACLGAWIFRKRAWFGITASGFFAGIAAYNHPTFLGAACVPFLFALKSHAVSWNPKEFGAAIVYYGGGAILGVGALFAILILPYFDQWHEQFFQNLHDSDNFIYGNRGLGWLQELVLLKSRFSTYGMAYANWYLLVFVFCIVLFRPTIYFFLAVIWLCASMFYLHLNTLISMQYCITFAAGIPVLLLLCSAERFSLLKNPKISWAAVAFIAIQIPWTAWRATDSNDSSLQFAHREKIISVQLDNLTNVHAVAGGDETAFPVLARGLRFFYMHPKWAFSPTHMQRFFSLSEQQADYFVSDKGKISPEKPDSF